jgi:nucleoside-diphosphate-sugar epimerase
MRVLVTGAAGFIGSGLTAALLGRGALAGADGQTRPITGLVLADRVEPRTPARTAVAVRTEVGDFRDPAFRERLLDEPVDSVFHLAATLTTDAEADAGAAVEVNVGGLIHLLELCRRQSAPPRFVFASSIAAFGGSLPETVDDDHVQRPQTSYGTHKAIAELLLNDYSRHRVVDGRALRLPIVLIRPGGGASVSDQVAGIVREPLLGRDVQCPLLPETRMPVASVRNVAESLLTLHDVPAESFRDSRAINLPALTITVASMLTALKRVAPDKVAHVSYQPDARVQAIVDSWPKRFVSPAAERLGITADPEFDSIIRDFLELQGEGTWR